MNTIKKDYSLEIEEFLKNGGKITKAVNSNKVTFNSCDMEKVERNAAKPSSPKNKELREIARFKGAKTYKTYAPCVHCGTSVRSVTSNNCIECDRRRSRKKISNPKHLEACLYSTLAHLIEKNNGIELTLDGKKYRLNAELLEQSN